MTAAARRRRAAVAERLLSGAPRRAPALDWDTLGDAPAWLALDDDAFATFQCRVGALLYAGVLRLWIDRGRLAAAQRALGAPFMEALLSKQDEVMLGPDLAACLEIEGPAHVQPALRLAGASVLLAALPAGALCDAVGELLAPVIAATMAPPRALSLVARAEALARDTTPAEAAREGAGA